MPNKPTPPPHIKWPQNRPTPPPPPRRRYYTGRCECGSKNLWDDNAVYGCKDCGKFYSIES